MNFGLMVRVGVESIFLDRFLLRNFGYDFFLLFSQIKCLRHLAIPALRPIPYLQVCVHFIRYLDLVKVAPGHCQASPLSMGLSQDAIQLGA